MKKTMLFLLVLVLLVCGAAQAEEDKPAFEGADEYLDVEDEFKIVEPGKPFTLNVACPDYKKTKKAVNISVRLEDGTEVGKLVLKAAKGKLNITLPKDRPVEAKTALYFYHNDTPAASRYICVIDNDYEPVRGNYTRDDKMIALTFDCGYGEKNTMWLLDTLKEYNAHATFFTIGRWVDTHSDPWITRILAEGHELGNHTTNHPRLTETSYKNTMNEINGCAERMAEKCNGYTTNVFRPPYGSRNKKIDALVRYMGYEQVLWEVESGDARNFTGKQILKRVLTHVKPGDIILMHNAAPELKNYLPDMLAELSGQGYTFGSVSELMNWN